MSVATREAKSNKRPVWAIFVQGVPFVFANSTSPYSTVPLSGGQSAIYNAMRRVQTHTNIAESSTIEIAALLVATPVLQGQTLNVREGTMLAGGLRARGRITSGYAGLARYRREALGTLATAIAASTTAATASVIVWGDVTASIADGDYLYCGRETFRVNGAASYSGVTNKTTITAYRGQCGTDRDALTVGLPVYQSPPFWLGRRVTMVRMHVEETDYATWFNGLLKDIGPDGPTTFSMEADDFIAARSREKIQMPLFGFDAAKCPGPVMNDIDADPANAQWYFPLAGSMSARRAWEGGDIDDTALPNGAELTAVPTTRFVQVGGEIVYVPTVLRGFNYGTGGQFPVALQVPEAYRQMFGSGRFADIAPEYEPFGQQDPNAVKDTNGVPTNARLRMRDTRREQTTALLLSNERKDAHQLLVLGGSLAANDFDRHLAGIALALLQGGGSGTYSDAVPWGAGLPDSMIDLDAFTDLVEEYPLAHGFIVLGLGGAEWSPFEEAARLLAPLNVVLTQTPDGLISVAPVYETPDPLLAAATQLTVADLAAAESKQALQLPAVRFPLGEAIGGVTVLFAPPVTEQGAAGFEMQIADGESAAYQAKPGATLTLDCSSLQLADVFGTAQNIQTLITEAALTRLAMFKRPWPRVEFAVKTAQRGVALGDAIQIDLTGLMDTLNPETGATAGFTTCQVRVWAREPDAEREIIRLSGPISPSYGNPGLIAPSAVVSVSTANGTNQDVTVSANVMVESGSTNPHGTNDGAHFPLNSYVRFFKTDGSGWRGGGDEAQITAKASDTAFTVALSAALQADRPAVGDIVELSEWPTSKNDAAQKYCIHLADDGATANVHEGDEFLPSSFGPSVYDDAPFEVAI